MIFSYPGFGNIIQSVVQTSGQLQPPSLVYLDCFGDEFGIRVINKIAAKSEKRIKFLVFLWPLVN